MASNDPAAAVDDELGEAISGKLYSIDSEGYRRNMESVLTGFAAFARGRGVSSPVEITPALCRDYALSLRDDALDADVEFSASSARSYYACVRALLSWCVETGLLKDNPAKGDVPTDVLPEPSDDPGWGDWTPEQRTDLIAYVDATASEAAAGDLSETETRRAFRDRAFFYLLALTPLDTVETLRWATLLGDDDELLPDVVDSPRRGSIPAERVLSALEAHRECQSPAAATWPVFPTWHRPTLVGAVRTELRGRDKTDQEIDTILSGGGIWDVFRDHSLDPPALSENGARYIMQRLCEDADIQVEGPYLQPGDPAQSADEPPS